MLRVLNSHSNMTVIGDSNLSVCLIRTKDIEEIELLDKACEDDADIIQCVDRHQSGFNTYRMDKETFKDLIRPEIFDMVYPNDKTPQMLLFNQTI